MAEIAADLGALIRHVLLTCGKDFLQAIDDLELSLSQIKTLQLLHDGGSGRSLKDLGDALELSLPAVSRAVEGLVQRKLVTRVEDPDDRRSKRVAATARGRAVTEELIALRFAGLTDFVAGLPDDERAGLADALSPLLEHPDIAAMRRIT